MPTFGSLHNKFLHVLSNTSEVIQIGTLALKKYSHGTEKQSVIDLLILLFFL